MSVNILNELAVSAKKFESRFEKYFDFTDADFSSVSDAMKYSAMGAGKRIRPFMVTEFCKLFNGDIEKAYPLAAALECIHTYSLIHDDLPCMDNDDLRRGRPTCHKKYGEEYALLAGDALLTYAFEIVSKADILSVDARLAAVRALSEYSGLCGMVGGQTIDLKSEGESIDLEKLLKLHSLKTGALFKCAATLGAIAAQADKEKLSDALEYATHIGLAFQIADDILDVTADEGEFGKPVGSDAENGKNTFVTLMTLEMARTYAETEYKKAVKAIEKYEKSECLCRLAEYIIERKK